MKKLLRKMFRNETIPNLETKMTESDPATLPVELNVNNVSQKENSFGRVNKFLNFDHYSDGLAHGYLLHSEAGMELYIKDLKSKFRMEINALDELLRDVILSKRKKLIDLGDMLPNIKQQLELEIASDEEMRIEVKYQKMMSVEGEGWISQVLYAFEKGYRKGMLDGVNIGTIL